MIKKKISKKDLDDWKSFLADPSVIQDKDSVNEEILSSKKRFSFDFHGYSINEANKKVSEIINFCYEKKISEIIFVTGKGSHSKPNDDVYASKDQNILKNTIPNFIKNNIELSSKIKYIKHPDQEQGGTGALLIKLKKL